MEEFFVVRSSEVKPDELQRLLADRVAEEQARQFRRPMLAGFAVVIAGAWVLAWPIHVLPHTVLWSLLATATFVIGLISPPRIQMTSSGRRPKRLR